MTKNNSYSISLCYSIIKISIGAISISLWKHREKERIRILFSRFSCPYTERDRERNSKFLKILGGSNG